MKVAIIHDWLTGMRGGERVLEELCALYPHATLFTLFHNHRSVSAQIESMQIRTSFLDRFEAVRSRYRYFLPLFPGAIRSFDLREFDLIISNSHAVAKGVRKPPSAVHVCYCLTPMRYIWEMQSEYFHYGDRLGLKQMALRALTSPLRAWDRSSAADVDHFIADSKNVQERISRCYGRTSNVIYPPIDTTYFTPSENGQGSNYYLIVSALVPYKRLDVAIDAFNEIGNPLKIVGAGPDLDLLRRRARANIEFLGFVSDAELRELYRHCRGLIVPGREDFCMTSLEAQACGSRVVAYASGGLLESVVEGETGVFFARQSADDLADAVRRLERLPSRPELPRANAEKFSSERFRSGIRAAVEAALDSVNRSASIQRRRQTPETRRHPSLLGFPGMCKRLTDVLVSAAGLILLGPIVLLMALVVRWTSPGSGLFIQRRLGLHGRSFLMVKLRTMRNDAEAEGEPKWAVRDDPRCTRIGGILRRFGFDELPQLWNVLMGDMSLVGPRPERPEFHEELCARFPQYQRRLEVRGGMTGLAQLRGWRGDTSIEKRLECDLEYIDSWSYWKDFFILIATPSSLGSKVQKS